MLGKKSWFIVLIYTTTSLSDFVVKHHRYYYRFTDDKTRAQRGYMTRSLITQMVNDRAGPQTQAFSLQVMCSFHHIKSFSGVNCHERCCRGHGCSALKIHSLGQCQVIHLDGIKRK